MGKLKGLCSRMRLQQEGWGNSSPPWVLFQVDLKGWISVQNVTLRAFTFFPQEFEDLDEIVARYVQPMASLARDLLNHKYYQDCSGGDRKVSPGPFEG